MRISLPWFISFLKKQALYIAVSGIVAAIFWAVGQDVNPLTILVYSLSLANLTVEIMEAAKSLYWDRRFPYNWIAFLLLLLPLLAPIYVVSTLLVWWIARPSSQPLLHYLLTGWKFPILISLVFAVASFLYRTSKERLEKRNRELQQCLEQGTAQNRAAGRGAAAGARDPAGAAAQGNPATARIRSCGSVAAGARSERGLFRRVPARRSQAVHLHCRCGGQRGFGRAFDGARASGGSCAGE